MSTDYDIFRKHQSYHPLARKKVGFMHIFTFESILYYNRISTKINKYYEWTLILVDMFENVRLSLNSRLS